MDQRAEWQMDRWEVGVGGAVTLHHVCSSCVRGHGILWWVLLTSSYLLLLGFLILLHLLLPDPSRPPLLPQHILFP